jgi:hypothetical protein
LRRRSFLTAAQGGAVRVLLLLRVVLLNSGALHALLQRVLAPGEAQRRRLRNERVFTTSRAAQSAAMTSTPRACAPSGAPQLTGHVPVECSAR